MKAILKNPKFYLAMGDLLLLPALFFCRWLTQLLLTGTNETCLMVRFGGKCAACGGTHFVQSLLNGQLVDAFFHNPYFFCLTAVLAAGFLMLNLWLLAGFHWFRPVVKAIFSVRSLVIATLIMLVFHIIRMMPIFIRLFSFLPALF